MKKKFLSGFLALALVMAAFAPVVAEDYKGSSVDDGVIKPASGSDVSGKIVITGDKNTLDANTPALVFSEVKEADKTKVDAKVAEVEKNGDKVAAKFDLEAVNGADKLIEDGVDVLFYVDGAEVGESYYGIHLGSEVETLTCVVVSKGVIKVTGIKSCSPFIIVKAATGSSGNNSGSSTKHDPTCEEALGKEWTWSVAKNTCVYRVTNTATK